MFPSADLFYFLVPLLVGFGANSASAFTAACSRRWGERGGRWVCFLLRNLFGIPVWAIGIGMAVRAPLPPLFRTGAATDFVAWLLVAAGSLVILAALWALRGRAAAPSVRDALVERGPYACVRHPLYAGLLLDFAGLALLIPTPAVVLACALGAAWALLQARLEELDLLQRLPAYRDYMQRVPRFIPRLRSR